MVLGLWFESYRAMAFHYLKLTSRSHADAGLFSVFFLVFVSAPFLKAPFFFIFQFLEAFGGPKGGRCLSI